MTSNGWGNMCPYSNVHRCVRPQKLLCPSRKSGHKTSTRSHDVFEYVLHSFLMKGTPTNSHDVFKYIVSFLTSRIDIRKILGSISICMHYNHLESCLRLSQMFTFLFLTSTVTRSDVHLRSRPLPFMATI